MKKALIVFGIIATATSAASANGYDAAPSGADRGVNARVMLANAPGGAYIDCDPRNPRSPVRCKPDGW